MPDSTVLTKEQRDALFTKLREDPKFREMMKKDWKEALSSVKIKSVCPVVLEASLSTVLLVKPV